MNKKRFFVWCVVKRHLGKTSLKHTRIRYDYIFRWLKKKELSSNTAEDFVLYLKEKGLRNASINSYIRVINLIDIYERENGKDFNLLKKISYFPKQLKVPTFLSYEEIEALLSVKIDYTKRAYKNFGHDLDLTYRYIIRFIASTGCRFSEMANMKVEDLHLGISSGYVIFKDTKTQVDRQVPLPPVFSDLLKQYTRNKLPSVPVFTSSTGHKITEQSFNPELRRRADLAGIKKHIYAHCFRNSYIIEHRRAGTDILTLATLVGHRDPKTTLGYDKFDYEDLVKGAENHPAFRFSLSPMKILERQIEQLEALSIMTDPRFINKVSKTAKKIQVSIAIKNSFIYLDP